MPTHAAQIVDIAARPANKNRDLIATEGVELLGLLSDDLVSGIPRLSHLCSQG